MNWFRRKKAPNVPYTDPTFQLVDEVLKPKASRTRTWKNFFKRPSPLNNMSRKIRNCSDKRAKIQGKINRLGREIEEYRKKLDELDSDCTAPDSNTLLFNLPNNPPNNYSRRPSQEELEAEENSMYRKRVEQERRDTKNWENSLRTLPHRRELGLRRKTRRYNQ